MTRALIASLPPQRLEHIMSALLSDAKDANHSEIE
jgi:hypothetical protein